MNKLSQNSLNAYYNKLEFAADNSHYLMKVAIKENFGIRNFHN